jgi:hypothetical protein
MAQYARAQAKEFRGHAEVLVLKDAPTAVKQLMDSRIKKEGNELVSLTVVLALPDGIYLKARLPDDALQAFKQKLGAIPAAQDKNAFASAWLGKVQIALSEEYGRASQAMPKNMPFTFNYAIPRLEAPPAKAVPEFRQAPRGSIQADARAVIPEKQQGQAPSRQKSAVVRGTEAAAPREAPKLPGEVTGRGTKSDPYVVDLYLTTKEKGTVASTELNMPILFDLHTGSEIKVVYKLSAEQLKNLKGESPQGYISTSLKSTTSAAFEAYFAERGMAFDGSSNTYKEAEGALKELRRRLVGFADSCPDELKRYLR